jgi:hypothetical protein
VISGDIESVDTYRALNAGSARLVVASVDDARNTYISLTVREACGDVPSAAGADDKNSFGVLELCGAASVRAR